MIHPLLGIAAVVAALGGLIVALKLCDLWLRLPPELMRKLMHVGTGCVSLTFPWLFHQQWPVVLLSTLSVLMLLAMRLVPQLRSSVGTVLHSVSRPSLGEIYFAVAVSMIFWLSGRDPLLYCVPVLILTLADTVAALIGIAYGRVHYVTSEGLKSAEGSIAFFAIAFLSVHVPLLLFTDVGRPQTLLIATIIGVLATLIEAAAWRGLDNLLIPLGAYAFLKLYLDKSTDDLVLRLAATLALLAFAMSWRRRSSLDDSALMAGALFGYGALMLGGSLWLVGPIFFFLAHAMLWPSEAQRRDHSVFAVLSVVITALLWLALHVRDEKPSYVHAYAATFGVHFAIVGVSRISLELARFVQARQLTLWIAIGIAFTLVQWLLIERLSTNMIAPSMTLMTVGSAAGVVVGATTFFLLRPLVYGRWHCDAAVHSAGFAAGLAGSLITFAGRSTLGP